MANILFVDDNPQRCLGWKSALEADGHNVLTAADGISGLNSFAQIVPDLIISDILMPRMDGFTFLREVRSMERQPIPFVFAATTDLSEEDRQWAQMIGADAILTRTSKADVVGNVVRTLLNRNGRESSP